MVTRRIRQRGGFTLVELVVVMAILGLLLTLAAPRYWRSFDRSNEVALKQNLHEMRAALDRFAGDQGRYPASLDELVERRYLTRIPVDPITGSALTWRTLPPVETEIPGAVARITSGAGGIGSDGRAYADW